MDVKFDEESQLSTAASNQLSNQSSRPRPTSAQKPEFRLLTLDNFDENSFELPILTSPRSVEACRMLGVEPEELVKRSASYFAKTSNVASVDTDFLAKRAARYERNRQIQLHRVRMQRREMIDNGFDPRVQSTSKSSIAYSKRSGPASTTSTSDRRSFSIIDKEKRELERIQIRQAQELQQLIDFEMKTNERERERILYEQEARRRQEEASKARRKQEREEIERKRKLEIERADQERQEMEEARRRAAEEQMERASREKELKAEEERRKKESRKREIERARRQEELRHQAEQIQAAQERAVEMKAREMEARDARRRRIIEERRREKAEEIARKREHNQSRIMRVLRENEVFNAQQREEAERKQIESEERRRRYEEERREREEEMRLQAKRKQEEISMVRQQLEMQEEERRARLQKQEYQTQQHLREKWAEQRRRAEERRRFEERQNEERRLVKERMERQLEQKRLETIAKTEEKMYVAQQAQERNRRLVRKRLQEAKLREEEIQSALARKQRQDAYKAEQLQSRIAEDDLKAQYIKEERRNLLKRRQQAKERAEKQKRELMKTFYKMKVTKKYELPSELQESLNRVSASSRSAVFDKPYTSSSTSQLRKRPQSAGSCRPQRKSPSATASQSTLSARSNTTPTAASPVKRLQRPKSAVGFHSARASTPDIRQNGTADDIKVHPRRQDGREKKQKSEHEDTESDPVEELRRVQNMELLELLVKEHHAEEQRGLLLEQANNREEHERLEEKFDHERMRASEQIVRITTKHEKTLRQLLEQM